MDSFDVIHAFRFNAKWDNPRQFAGAINMNAMEAGQRIENPSDIQVFTVHTKSCDGKTMVEANMMDGAAKLPHNPDGPAVILFSDTSGEILAQTYALHGTQMNKCMFDHEKERAASRRAQAALTIISS